jgi:hypothetical protein
VSPYGDLAQRKVDYWRTNEVKNLKKLIIHKHLLKNNVLQAKCVENWKSETH